MELKVKLKHLLSVKLLKLTLEIEYIYCQIQVF
jgi:hypothetical protein